MYSPKRNRSGISGDNITGHEALDDGSQRPDTFTVEDVEFMAPEFTAIWGDPLRRADGGILQDGMNVSIYYVPYKFENVIMRLEVLSEDSLQP